MYCKKFNDLFDIFNSGSPSDAVPLRKPLSLNSPSIKILEDYIPWLTELQALNPKRKCSFIDGWIQSINVLLLMRKEISQDVLPYMCVRNLCQDELEKFFGKVRLQHKFPTPQNFIDAYCRLSTASLIRAPLTSNVEVAQEDLSLDMWNVVETVKHTFCLL
jgi:hypothetical protein